MVVMHRLILLPVLVIGTTMAAVACGSDDDDAFSTLPPIETTTTSSTTTTTISTERRFYTIQPGESLAVIAESFGVTVESIVELNDSIEDPNNIQADQTIEIPSGIQVITELPGTATPETSPEESED